MYLLSLFLTVLLFLGMIFLVGFLTKKLKKKSLKEIFRDIFHYQGTHSRIKKIMVIGMIFIALIGFAFISSNLSNRISYYRLTHSKSEWRETNGQSYLYVEADTHYDLGYLTGNALSQKILYMKGVLLLSALAYGISYSTMIEYAKEFLPSIPQKYQEEIQGMSDGATAGSGIYISFEDILFQSLFFEVIYGRYNPVAEKTIGCTSIAAINNNGSTIIGQNVDLLEIIGNAGSFVLHKLGDDPLIFTYRVGGTPAMPIGKNEMGLNIVLTLVKINLQTHISTPLFVLTREGLASYDKADDLCNTLFPENKATMGLTYLISDKQDIISMQSIPDEQLKTESNLLVHSNTYTNPDWQDYLENKTYSKERQELAENLATTAYNDGSITNKELMNILGDDPIICRDEGGLMSSETVAFFTSNMFGIGNCKENVGNTPI